MYDFIWAIVALIRKNDVEMNQKYLILGLTAAAAILSTQSLISTPRFGKMGTQFVQQPLIIFGMTHKGS